jgi:hypothetical protein
MSTIVMKEEIQQVCDALCFSILGTERYHFAVYDKTAIPDIHTASVDDMKDHIWAWCNRVYIANQCAYILTYAHRGDCDRNIDFIVDADHCHNGGELIQNPGRFYRMLQSIQYNLCSNGGQVMLCHEDMVRLDNLIAVLAIEIIGVYQREKGRA